MPRGPLAFWISGINVFGRVKCVDALEEILFSAFYTIILSATTRWAISARGTSTECVYAILFTACMRVRVCVHAGDCCLQERD